MDKVTVTIDGITLEVPVIIRFYRLAEKQVLTYPHCVMRRGLTKLVPADCAWLKSMGLRISCLLYLPSTKWYEYSYEHTTCQRSTQS